MTRSRNINRPRHIFTPEEESVIRQRYPNEKTQAIADDLGVTVHQLFRKAYAMGLKKNAEFLASPESGRWDKLCVAGAATQFKKGQVPANKGKRRPGYAPGRMAETQFKKGHLNGRAKDNAQPIGHEKVNADGYLVRKTNNDLPFMDRWQAVHRIVWEEAHGPIPQGHIVVFKTGSFTTESALITVDRLELITRSQLMKRNSFHTRYPKEIGLAIQARGVLSRQINKRIRQQKQEQEAQS